MDTLDEQRLRSALHDAAGDVRPAPSLLPRVHAGGARRLRLRRILVAGGLAGTLALGAGVPAAIHVLDSSPVAPNPASRSYDRLFDRPTGGDRAADPAYLAAVLEAWGNSHATSQNADRGIFDDLRGEPRVVWAGTTPAGPAAVVAQRAFLHEHANTQLEAEGVHTLLGFVGPGPGGRPRVVADAYPAPGVPPVVAAFVDARARTLVALDTGEPLSISAGWRYGPDGTARRAWRPLVFRGSAAVATVPADAPAGSVRLSRTPFRGFDDLRNVMGRSAAVAEEAARRDPRLPWRAGSEDEPALLFPIGDTPWAETPADDVRYSRLSTMLARALAERTEQLYSATFSSLWVAYGTLPDRLVVVGERALDADPSRVYALVTDTQGRDEVVDGGEVDPRAPLPVAVRLPDGRGWVVASYGADLRYRERGSAWVVVGRDAALLPDGQDLEVEVALPGRQPVVVPLPLRSKTP